MPEIRDDNQVEELREPEEEFEASDKDDWQIEMPDVKNYALRYLSYLPTSFVLAERVEYIKDTFGRARHKKLAHRAGRTSCTPCSLVSRSHA